MPEVNLRRTLHPTAWVPLAATIFLGGSLQAQDQGPTPVQIAMGDSIFNGNQFGACWACHGSKGKGTSNGPKLNDSEWLHTDGSLEGIKGIITSGVPKPKKVKTPMPPMGGAKLSPEEIDALAAYVHSLSQKKKD